MYTNIGLECNPSVREFFFKIIISRGAQECVDVEINLKSPKVARIHSSTSQYHIHLTMNVAVTACSEAF